MQASGNSALYGLSTACIALICGFMGARLFGRV
jgi:ABC-type Fe3+ transport system permease subunit